MLPTLPAQRQQADTGPDLTPTPRPHPAWRRFSFIGLSTKFGIAELFDRAGKDMVLERRLKRSAFRAAKNARELPPCSISDLATCGSLEVDALE